jgi:hypothetical protein
MYPTTDDRTDNRRVWTPPRRPHTMFLTAMGVILSLFLGWSFLHEVNLSAAALPAIAAHALHRHVKG